MVSACLQLNYHNWKNRKTVTAPRHNYMSDSQLPENATNNPGSKALLNEFTQLNEEIQHVQKIKGVPSAESSRSAWGLGKGVSGKPYPRLYNARRPRLELVT